jgi:predicted metalloprotease
MTKIRSTDGSVINDQRGQGSGGGGLGGLGGLFPSGGGGGGGLPGGIKAGGGLLAIVIALAALFLPKILNSGNQQAANVPNNGGTATNPCSTELEQIVCGASVDVQLYWSEAMPEFFGKQYQQTQTTFFDNPIETGCGQATSEIGPFYCPLDNLVYIDLGFMQQLEQQLIGQTSDLAEQYIVAHEYGHHVQNLLGTNAQVQQQQQQNPGQANRYSVAMELQADCFAGSWVGSRDVLENEGELDEAIKAAEGVGDDRIQQKSQGRIDPESWTHGSAEQRKTWFLRGYNSKDPTQCNTFSEL